MATTATTTRSDGRARLDRARPAAGRSGRRRQMPLVVVGVLLVVGCALAFADASLHLGRRQAVLVVAEPVAAGQVLSAADLRSARVSVGSGLAVVPVTAEANVVGRPAAVPLMAGELLSGSEVGPAPSVASGFDVVAVGLKPGGFPPGLAAGDRVEVVPVPSSSGAGSTGSAGSPVRATVTSVEVASAASGSPTVFSLQVAKGNAGEVATLAAAGQASLVQLGAGS